MSRAMQAEVKRDLNETAALGKVIALLQGLRGWSEEARSVLVGEQTRLLADLARAFVRNHTTPAQVQHLISLLDRRLADAEHGGGLDISSHEVLRLVFESVAGKAYGDDPWKAATEAGALPFDNGLDPRKLANRLGRWGLSDSYWYDGQTEATESLPSGLQGVAVSRVKKYHYPEHGALAGDYEKGLDKVAGQRTSLSLGAAMLMLAPQMVDKGQTLIFSGTTIQTNPSDSLVDYRWFPGLARLDTPEGRLSLVKVRLDCGAGDDRCHSVRLARA